MISIRTPYSRYRKHIERCMFCEACARLFAVRVLWWHKTFIFARAPIACNPHGRACARRACFVSVREARGFHKSCALLCALVFAWLMSHVSCGTRTRAHAHAHLYSSIKCQPNPSGLFGQCTSQRSGTVEIVHSRAIWSCDAPRQLDMRVVGWVRTVTHARVGGARVAVEWTERETCTAIVSMGD